MNLARNSGNLLSAAGVIHNVVGCVVGWKVLKRMASEGLVNSVKNEMEHQSMFWFLFAGFVVIVLGKLMQDCLDAEWLLPRWLGFTLLVLSLIGCIMMPISGFWLVIPLSLLIISTRKKRKEILI